MSVGEIIDVYELTPVDCILCVWGPEVGFDHGGSEFFDTDEWLGHVPVQFFINDGFEFERI